MNVTVTQISRPIRLAFLIKPKSKKSFLRAIRVCSSLWSGFYFPILPFYQKFTHVFREEYQLGESIHDYYYNIIENFDPDYVVADDGLDNVAVSKHIGDRKIISFQDVEKGLLNSESEYGIAIEDILSYLKESEFKYERSDDIKVVLPKVKEKDLFIATLAGAVAPAYLEKLKSTSFPKNYIKFPKAQLTNIESILNEDSWNFLKLTQQKIHASGNPFWSMQPAVYLIDHTRLNDLINFWNIRALGWHVIAVPVANYTEELYQNLIKKHQKEFADGGGLFNRINILVGRAINKVIAEDFQSFLNGIQTIEGKTIEYIGHWWFPRIWLENHLLNYDKSASVFIRSDFKKQILATDGLTVKVPVVQPPFTRKYVRHAKPRFVNEVSYEFDDIEGKYAQVIPAVSSTRLNFVIRGSGYDQWRFSKNGIFHLSRGDDEYLSFNIPKADELFGKWFEEKNLKIRHSSAGKLANQLLRNIGGIYGTNFFASEGIPPILSLFENGKVVKMKTLYGELSKLKAHFRDQPKDIIKKLIDKNIVQFGNQIQCTFCNQRSFYTLSEFQDILKCPVCHNKFYTPAHSPDDIHWAYRGIGPFSRNNKADGIVPVLLALRFFKITLFSEAITPSLSFEILENDKVINEVDFGIYLKKFKGSFNLPDIFFCECKSEVDFEKKDIEKMKKLGKLFPGSILTFVTLKKELSANEKELITSLANYFRKGLKSRPINPILILTSSELLQTFSWDAIRNLKPLMVDHLKFSDEIGHLCDVTNQVYLGLPSYEAVVHARVDKRLREAEEAKAAGAALVSGTV